MRIVNLSNKHIGFLIIGLLIFLSSNPYFIWNTHISLLISVLIIIVSRKIKNQKDLLILVLVLPFYLYIAFKSLNVASFYGILSTFLCVFLFLINQSYLVKSFNGFRIIFSILISISLLVFLVVYVLHISIKYNVVSLLNRNSYLQYPFLISRNDFLIFWPRFMGYFEEPGVVGSICAILLTVYKYNFKDKFNIPILIAGLLSFSIFFYMITLFYALIFTSMKRRILILLIAIVSILVLRESAILNYYLFDRMSFTDVSFLEDDRTNLDFEKWYTYYSHTNTNQFWFGLGAGESLKHSGTDAFYKDLIVDYGLIWFALYVFTITLLAKIKIKNTFNFLAYILLFYGMLYQRPYINVFFYAFIIYVPMYVIPFNEVSERRQFKGNENKILHY